MKHVDHVDYLSPRGYSGLGRENDASPHVPNDFPTCFTALAPLTSTSTLYLILQQAV